MLNMKKCTPSTHSIYTDLVCFTYGYSMDVFLKSLTKGLTFLDLSPFHESRPGL